MKKKIITVSFVVLVVTVLIFRNAEDVEAASGMCTYQEVYFTMEAIDPNRTGDFSSSYGTTWDSGSAAGNQSNTNYEIRDMTVDDCVNYVNGENEKSASGYGNGDTFTDSGGNKFNSGANENDKSVEDSMSGLITGLGGGNVRSGCEAFVNGTVKMKDGSITTEIDPETGESYDRINRDYDLSDGEVMTNADGVSAKYSGQAVIKTYTKPCSKEEEEAQAKICTCSSGGGGGGSTTFSKCGGVSTSTSSQCASGSFVGTSQSVCTKYPVITWTVTVKTIETISITVNIHPQTVYAGGGVGISVSHSASTSSSISGQCVSTNEKKPSCKTDGYSYNEKTEQCEKQVCKKDDAGRKVCETLTEGYLCIENVDEPAAGDISKAMEAIEKAAKGLGGGGGSSNLKEITISARQSNDEKDKNFYSLNEDPIGQGVAISSTSNKYKTEGYGATDGMTSVVNQACINKNTGIVRYTTGSCTEEEVDGGHKYYIPLKFKSGKFGFNISSGNIGIVSNTKLDAMCTVNVEQKLYNFSDDGGTGDGSDGASNGTYKFIYRPVDLTNPKTTVFPDRQPASNWQNLRNTSNDSGTGAYDTLMTRNNLEYSITLDANSIEKIKTINDEKPNYASLSTISLSGKSTLLEGMGVVRSNKTVYNELGNCNKKVTTIIDGKEQQGALIETGTECW